MNRVVVLHTDSSASLVVLGTVDASSAPEIARHLGLLIARYPEVHVDLGNVGSVDEAGLALLRDVVGAARGYGVKVVLVSASDAVETALDEPFVA
jgi:anti-anti-sigma factor